MEEWEERERKGKKLEEDEKPEEMGRHRKNGISNNSDYFQKFPATSSYFQPFPVC